MKKKPSLKSLKTIKRKKVSTSSQELVKIEPLYADSLLPLLITPTVAEVDVITWAKNNKDFLEEQRLKYGGILFRGFNVPSAAKFNEFVGTVFGDLLEYRERSSPRNRVEGNVYISTVYPADQPIFFHNESSYSHTWALNLLFYCLTPPDQQGETPIADSRRVLARISPETQKRFEEKGVMYVRNLSDKLGLSWQTVFQTSDKAEVEAYCRKTGYEIEWKAEDTLKTRRVGPAVVKHPKTGEAIWFNHAAFFHISTLEPKTQQALLNLFDEEDLPNNTYYGDGTPIEAEVLEELRQAYRQESVKFPWQQGDILMLDNMLVAHAREPYTGPRQILVGMTTPLTHNDL